MTCNGTQYCHEGDEATITIIADNKEIFKASQPPICVEIENNLNNKKCWHFWGTTDGQVTFEHFACGVNASYQTNSSLQNNGAWLIVDGVVQNGTGYFYWAGTFNGKNYARHLQQVFSQQSLVGSVSGSCNTCLNTADEWTVTIKDKNGSQLYQKSFNQQPNVDVSCNGCPPNHIKCKCNSYPGYCCIPCDEIKGGIAAATAAVRGINRG